jgi:hypothetical protein
MNRFNKGQVLPGLLVLAGAVASLGIGAGTMVRPELARPAVTIYSVKSTTVSNATVGGWGSGKCVVSKDISFNGANALQITSSDLYDGGRIDLKSPVDMTQQFNDPEAYLQVAVRFATVQQQTGTGRIGGMRGGMPGMPGGMGQMGAPGQAGRMGGMGGARAGMAGGMPGAAGTGGFGVPSGGQAGAGVTGGMPGMPGMAGGTPGGMPGMGQMGAGQAGRQGGVTGRTQTGARGGMRTGISPGRLSPGAAAGKRTTRYMRVLLALDNGQTVSCQTDLSSYARAKDGWTYIAMPLSAFKGHMKLNSYKVNRVVIGTDGTDAMFLAEVKTMDDLTPIQAVAGRDKQVSVNDKVIFNGSFISGTTAVKLSWDFDASDGIQEDATGPAVQHTFRKAGVYTVTLTASDAFGIKAPGKATIKVKVNP